VVIYYRSLASFFLSLNPEDVTDRLSRNVGKKSYNYSLRNNQEERSSVPSTLFVVKSRTFIRCLIAKNIEIFFFILLTVYLDISVES
jgi:hypothetical protein